MPLVTGQLTDFGLDPLTTHRPVIYFQHDAGPGVAGARLLSGKPVKVTPAYNGYFEAELAASATVAPEGRYKITIEYTDLPTQMRRSETLAFRLFVPAAGGVLADLLRVPANPGLTWIGSDPPANPSPGTWWMSTDGRLQEYDGRGWNFKENLRGPAGYNATGAAENAQTLADFTNGTAGENPFKTALDSRYSPVSSLVLNARDFAIYPDDMGRDSTAGLQAAVDTMETFGIGALEWPGLNLRINGTVRIKKPMHISAAYGAYANTGPTDRKGGGSIITTAGTPGSFVFDIAPEGYGLGESEVALPEHGGSRILGFKLDGLTFYGSATEAGAGPDRGAIRFGSVHTEFVLQDVKITNFRRQGVLMNGVYDGSIRGLSMLVCGSAEYPALDMANNTNALHIYGLHIEACRFPLRLGAAARHNQFIGGKIEMYTYGPTLSPIRCLGSYENVFYGVQFVQRNADDTFFYPTSDSQPHMILVDGPEARTVFDSCMFTTQPYRSETRANQGSRWIKTLAGTVQIRGGIMDGCWGGSGPQALDLGSRSIVDGLHMRVRRHQGARNLLRMASDCIIDNCLIDAADENGAATSGTLIVATGENNTWGANNKIRVTAHEYVSATGRQQFREMDQRPAELPVGTNVPRLGWTARGNPRTFSIWQGAGSNPQTWNSFDATGRFPGDEITILFADAQTTIVHGAAWKLRGAVNVTPPTGAAMHFRYDGTSFSELWRSF